MPPDAGPSAPASRRGAVLVHRSESRGLRDDAPTGSFFATQKAELANRERYVPRDQARQSVFAYPEVFSNRLRRHSALCYVSPNDFEPAG